MNEANFIKKEVPEFRNSHKRSIRVHKEKNVTYGHRIQFQKTHCQLTQ